MPADGIDPAALDGPGDETALDTGGEFFGDGDGSDRAFWPGKELTRTLPEHARALGIELHKSDFCSCRDTAQQFHLNNVAASPSDTDSSCLDSSALNLLF